MHFYLCRYDYDEFILLFLILFVRNFFITENLVVTLVLSSNMSKKVLEYDFQEKLELPITAFPPFKLRSSMVDTDPVIWVHLIEVYIKYIQTLLQLNQQISERSEEQLCIFVRSYLREIGNEQGQILSLGLINVQILENLELLKIWIFELIKKFGVIYLKLNGSSLWDFNRIYSNINIIFVRSLIDGSFKPASKRSINSSNLIHKHIEHLITNGKFDSYDLKSFVNLLNENQKFSITKKPNNNNKLIKKKSSFSENFISIEWLEILENLYSGGSGRFAEICQKLGIISVLSISSSKIASLLTELNINSLRSLSLYPLLGSILISEQFKQIYPDLSQKLPFLKSNNRIQVNQDDVDTLVELFPSLTISYTEKLLKKNDLNVEKVTNLLLENPNLAIPKESISSNRHVYEDKNNDVLINKKINKKSIKHVPDEHKNKTLTAALRLMYEADEDERDDTYDEAEVSNSKEGISEVSKYDKIEVYLWELFKKDQVMFDKTSRKSRQRKEMRNETNWTDEQIEGWAKMIKKSPKRAKLLEEKYMFRGNKPWRSSFYKPDPSRESTPEVSQNPKERVDKSKEKEDKPKDKESKAKESDKKSSHQNNIKRKQANNEKNKASKANHNRKAGHDKKMARGF